MIYLSDDFNDPSSPIYEIDDGRPRVRQLAVGRLLLRRARQGIRTPIRFPDKIVLKNGPLEISTQFPGSSGKYTVYLPKIMDLGGTLRVHRVWISRMPEYVRTAGPRVDLWCCGNLDTQANTLKVCFDRVHNYADQSTVCVEAVTETYTLIAERTIDLAIIGADSPCRQINLHGSIHSMWLSKPRNEVAVRSDNELRSFTLFSGDGDKICIPTEVPRARSYVILKDGHMLKVPVEGKDSGKRFLDYLRIHNEKDR